MMKKSGPAVNSHRLDSLDVFRGMAITAMILVNNPGSHQQMYPFLKHSPWHGCTLADLVFPVFLFILGLSLAFSMERRSGAHAPSRYYRIFRRSLLLFSLGLLLNLFPLVIEALNANADFSLDRLRIMGVLQRIAAVYLLASLTVLWCRSEKLWILMLSVLMLYWYFLAGLSLPGHVPGILSPGKSLAAFIDGRILTPSHMLGGGPFDPEGILSTFPAWITALLGYVTGIRVCRAPRTARTGLGIAGIGLALICAGKIWGTVFPVNKTLWTSSYVLFSGGTAMVLFAACFALVEVLNIRKGTDFFRILGLNAISIYLLCAVVTRILLHTSVTVNQNALTVYAWLYQTLFTPLFEPVNASLLFSLTGLALAWPIVYTMYKKQIVIKV